MSSKQTPEKRVGKTANLIIFIGILYSTISLLALTVCSFFIGRGYGVKTLLIGLSIVGLGYGIRYGKMSCLYVAIGLFAIVSIYFLSIVMAGKSSMMIARLGFSVWAATSLIISIPAMVKIKETGTSPDRNSKYKDFFLRRKGK